ncbi:MAG: hypothetical protein J6K75_05295 [Erysipelotrichaceae bacterium]|nr:hypothetical protein [Erysipelotrichaceae bacterium]
MALKSIKQFPDSLISITLFCVGAVLAPFVSNSFTVETMMIGTVLDMTVDQTRDYVVAALQHQK